MYRRISHNLFANRVTQVADPSRPSVASLESEEGLSPTATPTNVFRSSTIVQVAAAFCLFSGLFAGCSRTDERLQVYPVEGRVTLNGKPLANALVVLHPKDATNPKLFPARAQTDAEGSFHVSTYDTNDGAPAGEYAVTVQYYRLINKGNGSSEPGPNVLPAKYASPATTTIIAEIAAQPNTLPNYEVNR